jgi:hypothetical protein
VVFGVALVTATIGRISQDCAERFQGFAAAVRDRVAAAPVKHLDETGFRIGGKTQWLRFISPARSPWAAPAPPAMTDRRRHRPQRIGRRRLLKALGQPVEPRGVVSLQVHQLGHGVAPALRTAALIRRPPVADAHRDFRFQLGFPSRAIRGRSFGFGQRTHAILGQRSWHGRTISGDVTGRQWVSAPGARSEEDREEVQVDRPKPSPAISLDGKGCRRRFESNEASLLRVRDTPLIRRATPA